MVLPKAGRQKRGVAATLENSLLLGFGQRAAKLRFFIFHLRTDIFRKLPDDVFALGPRQTLGDGVQVAIQQVHGAAPYTIPSREELMLCHSASRRFRITLPSGERPSDRFLRLPSSPPSLTNTPRPSCLRRRVENSASFKEIPL